jgi:diacylglycerol diphosphate phosphatase/phosphatidate phosphatase
VNDEALMNLNMIYKVKWDLILEIAIRLILWWLFVWIEYSEPFIREIHESEVWQYQYPVTDSYVTARDLWLLITLTPSVFFIIEYILSKKKDDVIAGSLAVTLAYSLNGLVTTYFKAIVGRPRPDFFFRCFPDGKGDDYTGCVGNKRKYLDGRKSFPSGHSSFSFACMGFMSLYIARKVNLFQGTKKGHSWQLCVVLLPILIAATVAVSRTCDYHHHYEDVIAGSLIGAVISYLAFSLYFPKNIDTVASE